MVDDEVIARIHALVDEEHRIHGREGASEEDQERLDAIEVELDQCWDLVRQRRAKRQAGRNPDEAKVRGPDTVEHYQQ